MSKAKVYPIDTINGTVELDIAGEYFKLMVAPAAVAEIELLNDGNQALQALDVAAGFYQRIRFTKIRIRHTGAQAIKVLVAPAEGGSDNFTGTFTAQGTLGTLAQRALNGINTLVVDPLAFFGDDVTAAGEAFSGFTTVAAGGAGVNGHAQLRNPAGSGKVLYVDRLSASAQGGGLAYVVKRHDAAVGNVVADVANKNIGGAAPAGAMRWATNAGLLGTPTLRQLWDVANKTRDCEFCPPLRLEEGEGIVVGNGTANQVLDAHFEWRERTV